MKDIRGFNVAAVKKAIFHVFRMNILPPINNQKNSKEISDWKVSLEVAECYNKLFQLGNDRISNVNHIARIAFPTLREKSLSIDLCAYIASVCDIVLNPKHPSIEISKTSLQCRIARYKVSFYSILYIIFL